MKMQKIVGLLLLSMGVSMAGLAQKPYQRGVGLRFSSSYYDFVSATYKFFVSDAGAIDLDGGVGVKSYYYGVNSEHIRPVSLAISAAYQHHFEIPVRGGGLAWFIGGGITGYKMFSKRGDYDGFAFGVFPTGGVDFKIPRIPLAVSADYRPTIFLGAPSYYDSFYGGNFGVSARYTLGEK